MKRSVSLLRAATLFAAAILSSAAAQAQNYRHDPFADIVEKDEFYLFDAAKADNPARPYLPRAAVKTNLPYLATGTVNVAVELGLGRRWTLDLTAAWNPIQWQVGGTNQLWFGQPELRVWLCERFERHFFGIHALYGHFGQIDILTPTFVRHRYKGRAYGAGISWGYHTPLARRWALEFSLGGGWIRLDYDKFDCHECDDHIGSEKLDWYGPTKAAISLIYMIK